MDRIKFGSMASGTVIEFERDLNPAQGEASAVTVSIRSSLFQLGLNAEVVFKSKLSAENTSSAISFLQSCQLPPNGDTDFPVEIAAAAKG